MARLVPPLPRPDLREGMRELVLVAEDYLDDEFVVLQPEPGLPCLITHPEHGHFVVVSVPGMRRDAVAGGEIWFLTDGSVVDVVSEAAIGAAFVANHLALGIKQVAGLVHADGCGHDTAGGVVVAGDIDDDTLGISILDAVQRSTRHVGNEGVQAVIERWVMAPVVPAYAPHLLAREQLDWRKERETEAGIPGVGGFPSEVAPVTSITADPRSGNEAVSWQVIRSSATGVAIEARIAFPPSGPPVEMAAAELDQVADELVAISFGHDRTGFQQLTSQLAAAIRQISGSLRQEHEDPGSTTCSTPTASSGR